MFKTSSSLSSPVFANEIFSITIQLCYIGWEITSHHHRRTRGFPVSAIFSLLSSFSANFFPRVCRYQFNIAEIYVASKAENRTLGTQWKSYQPGLDVKFHLLPPQFSLVYSFCHFPCSLTRLSWLWLFNPHHWLRSRKINYKFIAESNSTSRELIPVIHSSTRDLSKQQRFFFGKKKLLNGEKSLLNEPWHGGRE